jgi:DNA-binding response OmpR family regulator/predicted  nucleic acid-binding Zn-ribbon protein
VEGDGFTRLVLLLRLRLAGFAVDFTSNGVLGLGKLRNCHPDILLIDVKLNGLSGVELLKAARSDSGFGDRPIYVFTQVNRMNRGTRKEVESLATKVFDKSSCTREDLVQIFASSFLKKPETKTTATPETEVSVVPLSEVVPSGAIEELIAGVREQSELLVKDAPGKPTNGAELLSRVSSLASCAKEAGLSNLARQAKALENLLSQLCKTQQSYTTAALSAMSRAVEVMRGMSFEVTGKKQPAPTFAAVFIDEAPYSNRAVEEALLETGFQPACFEDPVQARAFLASNRTDLIIANVVLPEAHGLSLADIRQLPLHVQTPIIYGPESNSLPTVQGDLPTSATRLDKAPVLLRELIVRALNEVQSPEFDATAAAPALAARGSASQAVLTNQTLAALPADDGFNLFAAAPHQMTVAAAAADSAPAPAAVPTPANNRKQAFDQLFNDANIPLEPIMRARPSTESADQQLETVQPLPENPVDEALTEEQAVEAVPLSVFQSDITEPPQPEAAPEDQATESEFVAAAGEIEPPLAANDSPSGLDTEMTSLQDSAEATPSNGEDMNNRIDAASGYLSEPAENGRTEGGSNQREDLAARVCAAEMALYHAQAQIEQREKDVAALEKQLAEAKAAANSNGDGAVNDGAEQKAQERCAELEAEVAALREAFEGLNGGFSDQQNGAAETAKQLQELEQRLAQNAAELEKAKTEQQKAEAELRQQLEAATSASQQTESARQEADARCARLEQELESLRKAQAQLATQKAQEQATASAAKQTPSEPWAGASASELEQQVRQGVAALAKATAELAKERGERQRNQQRVADLNGRLQVLHDDLSRTLQAQREDLSRLSALEEQHRQVNQALVRCTADIEEQQAEFRLVQEQLQKAKEANVQLRKDLSFFDEANKKFDGTRQGLHSRLESSLNAAREVEARLQQEVAERQKLAASLEETRREFQNLSRKRDSLEMELQNSQRALQDSEAKLVHETAERQRLAEALDSAQRGAYNGSERDLEFSKVQSALQLEQVERKRQESQLARTRQRALDAAHAARALRTSLRRQIREPVENLVNSARNLLELEMSETQKQLAEAVLQDVLLVQTRLREPGLAPSDSHDTTTVSKPSES